MFKWIGYLLIVALLIAIATSPSEKKFTSFANSKMDTTACKPQISSRPIKIFSLQLFAIYYARECKELKPLRNLKTGEPSSTAALPVYGEQQKYLGLFGKFWKL